MAKIGGTYEEIDPNAARVSPSLRVVQQPVSDAGKQMAEGGEALYELGSRIRKQQIDSSILQANADAAADIDRQMIELRKQDDWDQFEAHAGRIARETTARYRPRIGGLIAAQKWNDNSVRLESESRQRGQRLGLERGAEIERGAIIAAQAAFTRAAADPQTSQAELERLKGNAMAVVRLGRQRGFVGEDDIARVDAEVEGTLAARQAKIGREQQVISAVDAARGKHPNDLAGQLAEARTLPPEVREEVTTRIMEEAARDKQAEGLQLEALTDAAMAWVNEGTPLTPEQQTAYDAPENADLRNAILQMRQQKADHAYMLGERGRASRDRVSTDTYNSLLVSMDENREAFVAPGNLEKYAGQLTPGQYAQLRGYRERARSEARTDIGRKTVQQEVTERIISTGQMLAPGRSGVNMTISNNAQDRPRFNQFKAFVIQDVEAYMKANGGAIPDDAAQQDILNRAFADFNNRPLYMNENAREANVRYQYMPQSDRARIRNAEAARLRRAPTKAEVVAAYDKEVEAARGER